MSVSDPVMVQNAKPKFRDNQTEPTPDLHHVEEHKAAENTKVPLPILVEKPEIDSLTVPTSTPLPTDSPNLDQKNTTSSFCFDIDYGDLDMKEMQADSPSFIGAKEVVHHDHHREIGQMNFDHIVAQLNILSMNGFYNKETVNNVNQLKVYHDSQRHRREQQFLFEQADSDLQDLRLDPKQASMNSTPTPSGSAHYSIQ